MLEADDEFLALFKAESDERLQALDAGLLRLEANPGDASVVEALFREAHNLKGAARMLGAEAVAEVMHRFEDILGAAKRGQSALSTETVERLYRGLDGTRALVREALTGEAAGVGPAEVIGLLNGGAPAAAPAGAPSPLEAPAAESSAEPEPSPSEPSPALPASSRVDEARWIAEPEAGADEAAATPEGGTVSNAGTELAPVAAAGSLLPEPAPVIEMPAPVEPVSAPVPVAPQALSTSPAEYRIDTIRVEPEKLDALMTQAGELAVTRIRIERRLEQIEELLAFHEEWSREAGRLRRPGEVVGGEWWRREADRLERLGQLLGGLRGAASEDSARLDLVADQLQDGIRRIRLLPFSTLFQLFPRMVRDLAKEQGKQVNLILEGGETAADKRILEEMKDPLMHMLRNALDHGIEPADERQRLGKHPVATLRVRAFQGATTVQIEISDDGRGIDPESVRRAALRKGLRREEELATLTPRQIQALIFAPGFSTRTTVTNVSGRGVGMDVVQKNVERLKGTLDLDSTPGVGTLIRVRLPITLATAHVLIASVGAQPFALPVEHVETTRLVSPDDVFSIQGSDTIVADGTALSVAPLRRLLELRSDETEAPTNNGGERRFPCVVLCVSDQRFGVLVDDLVDEQEIVLKPLGGLLKRVRNVSGAAILGSGEVCVVLNPADLLMSLQKRTAALRQPAALAATPGTARKRRVLLVEDSITTRTQEKRILESAGYEVVTAVDGLDGYNKLAADTFDAVISDVEMPNMDGLSLTARIRAQSRWAELPVILVTTLSSDEDRRRGLEVGASAYIPKPTFTQQVLVETLGRLI